MIGSGKPATGRPKKGSERSGRNCKLCIRLSDEDLKDLEFVCNSFGITKTDYILTMIRKGVDSISGNNT